jgi:Fe-S cluster assembly iron-binding protein IscA
VIEATLAAATQLRVLVRSAGVQGVPCVRIRKATARGSDDFELVVEDRRGQGDEVYESRGIRFYMDTDTVHQLRKVMLDLQGREFVLTQQSS